MPAMIVYSDASRQPATERAFLFRGDVSSFALELYLAHCGSAGQSSDGVDHYAIGIDNDSLCLFPAALGGPFGEMVGFWKICHWRGINDRK
jgi:hypothetical protein